MKKTLNCPVCGYPEVKGDICPNCDTDLSLVRMLAELPPVIAPVATPISRQQSRAVWWLGSLAILVLGIGLWAADNALLSVSLRQPIPSPVISSNPSPPTAQSSSQPSLPPTNNDSPPSQPKDIDGFRYTVRRGDSLSVIAWHLYGDRNLWPIIVKANPSLEGRENFLRIGEVLVVPNREESRRENNR
ncbi:MAG: peptidoglycan-binding protein [Xenococcaceae cyanobacterium]